MVEHSIVAPAQTPAVDTCTHSQMGQEDGKAKEEGTHHKPRSVCLLSANQALERRGVELLDSSQQRGCVQLAVVVADGDEDLESARLAGSLLAFRTRGGLVYADPAADRLEV